MKGTRSGSPAAAAVLLAICAVISSPQQNQTRRVPQFDNDEVKVWKSIVLPNQPLSMHRHDHPRVIIALAGGQMKIVEQTDASETHNWDTGQAYWRPANPPGKFHADVNISDKPIEVIVVELHKAK